MDFLDAYPDGLVLTSLFWDCECEHNFIHPKAQTFCAACGAEKDEQPDSHANEVLLFCSELLTDSQRMAFVEAIERSQSA